MCKLDYGDPVAPRRGGDVISAPRGRSSLTSDVRALRVLRATEELLHRALSGPTDQREDLTRRAYDLVAKALRGELGEDEVRGVLAEMAAQAP